MGVESPSTTVRVDPFHQKLYRKRLQAIFILFGLPTMEIPVFTLDAFTNLPFRGNPAAVCPLMHVSNNI